ncbi:MAG: universal stress protein [Acidimicrobiia bacterium]
MVPLDTSEVSRSALPVAARLAEALGEDLLLVTVADWSTQHEVSELARVEGIEPIDALNANLRGQAALHPRLRSKTDLMPGEDPASAIVDRAEEGDISMIVIATHGRTGVSRWRLGSVTERVVRAATVPVMVVPAPWRVMQEAPAGKSADT